MKGSKENRYFIHAKILKRRRFFVVDFFFLWIALLANWQSSFLPSIEEDLVPGIFRCVTGLNLQLDMIYDFFSNCPRRLSRTPVSEPK
jgi:hypothetical protein